jgi:hypothetical protein
MPMTGFYMTAMRKTMLLSVVIRGQMTTVTTIGAALAAIVTQGRWG